MHNTVQEELAYMLEEGVKGVCSIAVMHIEVVAACRVHLGLLPALHSGTSCMRIQQE